MLPRYSSGCLRSKIFEQAASRGAEIIFLRPQSSNVVSIGPGVSVRCSLSGIIAYDQSHFHPTIPIVQFFTSLC